MTSNKERIVGIIADVLNVDQNELIDKENLEEFEIDSLSFIKIIVSLESEFDCEFSDEYLSLDTIKDLNALDEIIVDLKNKNSEEGS